MKLNNSKTGTSVPASPTRKPILPKVGPQGPPRLKVEFGKPKVAPEPPTAPAPE